MIRTIVLILLLSLLTACQNQMQFVKVRTNQDISIKSRESQEESKRFETEIDHSLMDFNSEIIEANCSVKKSNYLSNSEQDLGICKRAELNQLDEKLEGFFNVDSEETRVNSDSNSSTKQKRIDRDIDWVAFLLGACYILLIIGVLSFVTILILALLGNISWFWILVPLTLVIIGAISGLWVFFEYGI